MKRVYNPYTNKFYELREQPLHTTTDTTSVHIALSQSELSTLHTILTDIIESDFTTIQPITSPIEQNQIISIRNALTNTEGEKP